jgi:hypothetical protein
MDDIPRIKNGGAFLIKDTTKDAFDELITPDGGVVCDIIDEDDILVADGVAMTQITTGVWTLTIQSAASWQKGMYSVVVYATHGAYTSIKENKQAFEIF